MVTRDRIDGRPIGLMTFEIIDGMITGVHALLNPNKLDRIRWPESRHRGLRPSRVGFKVILTQFCGATAIIRRWNIAY